MHQTVKLCEIRDCCNGEYEPCPHNAVDPCRVYRNLESGRWHHEIDSSRVTPFKLDDETTFDVEAWLEQQYIKYMKLWHWNKPVHELGVSKIRGKKSNPPAEAPKFTNKELDEMASYYLVKRDDAKAIRKRIRDIGMEIRALSRMMKRYGEQSAFKEQIELLEAERDELKEQQSAFDKNASRSKEHAQTENKWANRWRKPHGKTGDFIYLYGKDGKMHEINRNGVMIDMEYVYLPENDMAYFESMEWCSKNLSIDPDCWIRACLNDDKIGVPIRHSGKKNANGARIRSLFDQKQYDQETLKFKWALVQQGFPMYDLHYSADTKALYEETVRDKIKRS